MSVPSPLRAALEALHDLRGHVARDPELLAHVDHAVGVVREAIRTHERSRRGGSVVMLPRLTALLAALRGRSRVTVPDLAARLGVVDRTVYRDVAYLRKLGAPIEWSYQSRTLRLTAPWSMEQPPPPPAGRRRSKLNMLSDEAIRSAVARAGSISAAAKMLRVAHAAMYKQVRLRGMSALLLPPRDRARKLRGMSDDDIARAIADAGSVTTAAKALGVSMATVYEELKRRRVPSPRRGRKRLADAELQAALDRAGSVRGAAEALGLTPTAIYNRIQAGRVSLPTYRPRKRKRKR